MIFLSLFPPSFLSLIPTHWNLLTPWSLLHGYFIVFRLIRQVEPHLVLMPEETGAWSSETAHRPCQCLF